MAILTIPDEHKTLTDAAAVRSFLAQHGVWFDQWTAQAALGIQSTQEDILEAYRHVLEPYMQKNGYQTADVISVHEQTPNLQELRDKFLREHTHTEDEVRFFVDGQGIFWFHIESPQDVVFSVTCQVGDLLSVPAGYKHWFDLGEKPFVKVIRIFIDAAGWIPHYTDSGVEKRYQKAAAVQP